MMTKKATYPYVEEFYKDVRDAGKKLTNELREHQAMISAADPEENIGEIVEMTIPEFMEEYRKAPYELINALNAHIGGGDKFYNQLIPNWRESRHPIIIRVNKTTGLVEIVKTEVIKGQCMLKNIGVT